MAPVIAAVGAAGLGGAKLLQAGTGLYSAVQARGARKEAKREEARQAALVKKQEEKIEIERKKQERVALERKQRVSQRELLTGGETGLAGETQATLLGGS